MDFDIEPVTEAHAEGYRAALDVVARERKYLGRTEAPTLEAVQNFVRGNIEKANPNYIAVREQTVIGWCDVIRLEKPLFDHVGILDMGIVPDARGQGLGAALLAAAIDTAWARGFVRLELTVFADNHRAIALYEKAGFQQEGILVDAVCIDGVYGNSILMGLVNR